MAWFSNLNLAGKLAVILIPAAILFAIVKYSGCGKDIDKKQIFEVKTEVQKKYEDKAFVFLDKKIFKFKHLNIK